MERYRDGDAAAFDVLYGRHKGGVVSLPRRGSAGITASPKNCFRKSG